MKQFILTFVFLVLLSINAHDFKFGKVSEGELKETVHPLDSSANAAVLYKNEKIRFEYRQGLGFNQIREVHERIKIYNKEGFDWATKKVRLYNESNSKSEDLQSLKGITYNLIAGKITEDKLKKDGMFEEEANKYWKYESFTMPNIIEGCVMEYSYEIASPFLGIDDIDFQYTIPINKFDFSVKTPEYFIYKKLLNPRAIYLPKIVETTGNNSITINEVERSRDVGSTSNFSQSKVNYKDYIITGNEINIPALKDEPLVDNLDNYRSKLILEHTATKWPNEPFKSYATTWDDVTKSIYDNPDFGSQLDRSGYYEGDIDAIIADQTDPIKKTFLIFEFVKSKVKWNEFLGFTSDIGAKKAYKDGAGNSADINLMLVSMLRYAGLKANPVLVSTKNHGIPLLPTRYGFNYVICLVENQNFNAMLDATNPYSTFNVLPTRALNWQGRVIRENGSSDWINLTPTQTSNEIGSLNVKINPDLTIEGKVRYQLSDYLAFRHRNRFVDVNQDEFIKYLEEDNGEMEISDLEIENAKDLSQPVKVTYNYILRGAIDEIGDKLYFSPLLFLATNENPFKQNKRNFPIDLTQPISEKYSVNIMLPEDYKVESLPQSQKFQFKGEIGEYSYLVSENGKFLQLISKLDLNTTLILPEDYEYFKDFFSMFVQKQAEKIVLSKI
jgi:transglutaminase-like putative cysteine protease